MNAGRPSTPVALVVAALLTVGLAERTWGGSNASNYGSGMHLAVNARTGGVSLDVELFRLPGVREEVSATLGLSYRAEDAIADLQSVHTVFGLPPGWNLNLTYLANRNTYVELHVDGAQTYVIDSDTDPWTTLFTAAGESTPVGVRTGLRLYNKVDTQFRTDPGTVTVGEVTSAYVLQMLNGEARYLSPNGLLIASRDRWGNVVEYHYEATGGGTDGPAESVRLVKMVDSWQQAITLSYCDQGAGGCTVGSVTITLPDGRTVGWLVEGDLTQITDAAGKVTVLGWNAACGGQPVLTDVTAPTGGVTGLSYQCMNVCTTTTAPGRCDTAGAITQWPVALARYECPATASGSSCPSWSQRADFLTITYELGGTPGLPTGTNYTGFPLYAPSDPFDPGADGLMSSGDETFVYTTAVDRLQADQTLVQRVERQYDFLHLEREEAAYLPDENGDPTVLAREKSHCYQVTGAAVQPGCPLPDEVDYRQLAANYQEPVISGTCVYATHAADTDGARVSVVTQFHDGFGEEVLQRRYHGTAATAVIDAADCDREQRLDPSDLTLVFESYIERSLPGPSDVDSSGWLSIGPDSERYGLMIAGQSFIYPDVGGESAATEPLETSSTPTRVTLTCRALGEAGRAVQTETFGSMAVNAAVPSQPGLVPACTSSPAWDTTVAPPKVHTYAYDGEGRVLSKELAWGGPGPKPGGVQKRETTFAYATTSTQDCGKVLEKTETDENGNAATWQVCVESGFPLSAADALGRATVIRYDATGQLTRRTLPNGVEERRAYFFACPTAPDGTQTCPNESAAVCPSEYDAAGRNCVVRTALAGSDPDTGKENTSFADGLTAVQIIDGLGRVVGRLDDVGASAASYHTLQVRGVSEYDDRGLVTSASDQVGVATPLVYTTAYGYDTKLRPNLACDGRGVAAETVYDDVGQETKSLRNGHAYTQTSMNDQRQVTALEDCALGTTAPAMGTGACPTVAATQASAACSGTGYLTQSRWDGAGLHLGTTASDPASTTGVTSVANTQTYSADLVDHAAVLQGTTASGATDVTVQAAWQRDLNAQVLGHAVTVTDAHGNVTTASSDAFSYDGVGNLIGSVHPLGTLTESLTYTATDRLRTYTDYAGTEFQYFYDALDRQVRYCHPVPGGGVAGETFTRDAITGKILTATSFTNPDACTACTNGDCGDVVSESIEFTYTRFGAVETKTYLNAAGDTLALLEWAYDAYQRPVCFADAVATALGERCPSSPVSTSWSPTSSTRLTWVTYWPDDDSYRRGSLQSICRGVEDQGGGLGVLCVDRDYYTSADTTGACAAVPSNTNVTGAFAGLEKTRSICAGGSCAAGSGSLVMTRTQTYDAHRRPCTVTATDPSGRIILESTYTHDQYGQVLTETHSSELDTTAGSNYTEAYTYDGMLRLTDVERTDAGGGLIGGWTYTYDARGNPTSVTETVGGGSATPVAVTLRPWRVAPRKARRSARSSPPWVHATLSGARGVVLEALDPWTVTLGGARPYRVLPMSDRNGDGHADLTLVYRFRDLAEHASPCVRAAFPDGATIWGCHDGATTHTTTTSYIYNADGAPTQITVSPDGGTPSVTYLTWDNFTPDAANPAQGTVVPGTGTLRGPGVQPGQFSSRFMFDVRDQLVGVTTEAGTTVVYTYDPSALLATATTDSETFEFTHVDGRISTIDSHVAGVMSRRLGPVRTLTDGGEQYIVRSGKDVAGVYDATQRTFTPYAYDPWGAPLDGDVGGDLDVQTNPYQYAGEYQDAVWGGYYLQARWYDPSVPTFVSRDPARRLNRYGYTEGNPRNRVDPTGRTPKWWRNWNHGGAKFMEELTGTGVRGDIERSLLGGFLMPIGIVANPEAFWQSIDPRHGNWPNTVMFVVGMAGEVVLDRFFLNGLDYRLAFGVRLRWDLVFGAAQSALAARRPHGGFDQKAFYQGLEYTLGSIIDARVFIARGYRPFDISPGEFAKRLQAIADEDGTDVHLFRVKKPLFNLTRKYLDLHSVGPIGDSLDMGWYHEQVIGVAKNHLTGNLSFFQTELFSSGAELKYYRNFLPHQVANIFRDATFRYVGRGVGIQTAIDDVLDNPLGVKVVGVTQRGIGLQVDPVDNPVGYSVMNFWGLNCQGYARRITSRLLSSAH